ncbi:MAG: hypothetical protein ACRDOU_05345 [Streptosporangiaceae bacterium]
MTRHADPPPNAISYEESLRRRIAEPGIICGPPVVGFSPFWRDLFPLLKPPGIRKLERQAREAEIGA